MTELRRCVLCNSKDIAVDVEGNVATSTCHACSAVVRVEFDPPDDPSLRGRIEVLVETDTKPTHTRRRTSPPQI